MAEYELRAYTPSRKPIGVVSPVADVNAAWQLGEFGALTFKIPRNSLRWNPHYMRHLNRIEYHDSRLPVAWVGLIVAHEPAGADVKITCISAEWLYTKRFTEREAFDTYGTAQELAIYLHGQASRQRPLGIVPGTMEMGGDIYNVTFELTNCGDGLKSLSDMSGGYHWVEKTGRAHLDPWLLRWALGRGVDRTADVLLCSEIVDDPQFKSSADQMQTAVHALGVEEDGERLYLYRRSKPAIEVYDLLEGKLDLPDVETIELLQNAAEGKLRADKLPANAAGLNIDNRRGMWGRFWLGDTVRTILPTASYAGLDTAVQVHAIQVDAAAGKMGLAVEVLD